jgi:biotin carboxyl carrier protein
MSRYRIRLGDDVHVIDVDVTGEDTFSVKLADGRTFAARLEGEDDQPALTPTAAPGNPDLTAAESAPTAAPATAATPADGPNAKRNVGMASPLTDQLPKKVSGLAAPLPGLVLSCEVKAGDRVTRGQTVLVLEAMKMKNDITAPADATVVRVLVKTGDQVMHGTPLIEFEG